MHDEILQDFLVVAEKSVLGPRGYQQAVLDRPDRHFVVAFRRSLSAFDDPAVKILAVENIDETILGPGSPGQRENDDNRYGNANAQNVHRRKS